MPDKDKKAINISYRRVSLFSPRMTWIVLLLIILLGAFFLRLTFVKESDRKKYKELIENAESSQSSTNGTAYTARQERQGIQKDMFFHAGGLDRLQIRLIADRAQLVLDHQDAHTYIVEQMQKVKCTMQEELYYLLPDGREACLQANGKLGLRENDATNPLVEVTLDSPGLQPMQMIRFIEANDAEYHYKDDRFVGHGVTIYRFIMHGHELKEVTDTSKPLMKGTAESVEFSLKSKNKDLNFKAHHLKATFFDMRTNKQKKMNL